MATIASTVRLGAHRITVWHPQLGSMAAGGRLIHKASAPTSIAISKNSPLKLF